MDWTAHVNAFYAQWVPRYLDPSERPWKEVLDFWIVRDEQRGRGVVMSAEEQVWKRLPQKSYFRKCFSEFSKLKVKQDTTVMPLNLQAEYLFENHRFKIRLHRKKQSHNARVKQWHKYMQTYRLHDLMQGGGVWSTDDDWDEWTIQLCPQHLRGTPSF